MKLKDPVKKTLGGIVAFAILLPGIIAWFCFLRFFLEAESTEEEVGLGLIISFFTYTILGAIYCA